MADLVEQLQFFRYQVISGDAVDSASIEDALVLAHQAQTQILNQGKRIEELENEKQALMVRLGDRAEPV